MGGPDDFCGDIVVNDPAARGHMPLVINSLNSLAVDAADISNDENISTVLDFHVSIYIASLEPGAGTVKTSAAFKIDDMTSSKRWSISPVRSE